MKELFKNFERAFFLGQHSEKTIDYIEQEIQEFNKKYQSLQADFEEGLLKFSDLKKLENCTQFFNYDRCLRYIIEFNDKSRYVIQISIFKYFSIYERSLDFVKDKYVYGPVNFINQNEDPVCDKIFSILSLLSSDFIWVDKETLLTTVEELSIINPDPKFAYHTKIADVLFSSHYL